LIHDSVISGGSSVREEACGDLLRLTLMAMPHADYATRAAAWRPDERDQPPIEPTHCDVPAFTVVDSIVPTREMLAIEYLIRTPHIDAAFTKRPRALVPVAGDAHI